MAFPAADLARLRPALFHFTSRANVARIERTGRLACAADLLAAAGRGELLRERRKVPTPVEIGGEIVIVCDQRPLRAGAIVYDAPGWDFARYVEHLNRRVFFWPGRATGPIAQGRRHLASLVAVGYDVTVLRVGTAEVIESNAARGPLVSRVNSGAPRNRAPRGARTFLAPEACDWRPVAVAEVTFESHALLPPGRAWLAPAELG